MNKFMKYTALALLAQTPLTATSYSTGEDVMSQEGFIDIPCFNGLPVSEYLPEGWNEMDGKKQLQHMNKLLQHLLSRKNEMTTYSKVTREFYDKNEITLYAISKFTPKVFVEGFMIQVRDINIMTPKKLRVPPKGSNFPNELPGNFAMQSERQQKFYTWHVFTLLNDANMGIDIDSEMSAKYQVVSLLCKIAETYPDIFVGGYQGLVEEKFKLCAGIRSQSKGDQWEGGGYDLPLFFVWDD
ncbi:MAG: hypothetical protein LBJ92_02915 [Holosporales bacterium]|jgi:hypothetical protein|nr:hypothetical protein [Holosporales bacterium]